jgi:hypothetical protein
MREEARIDVSLVAIHAPSGLRLISLPYFYYYHSKNHYVSMITKNKGEIFGGLKAK